MKWFQHDTDAKDDIKLKRLKKRFGMAGYGIWWWIVETVGREGVGGHLEFKKYPREELSHDLSMDISMLDELIGFMGEIELIDPKCLPNALYISKLPERADDFSKRQERALQVEAEKKVKGKKESPVHNLIYYFKDKHKDVCGCAYSVSWGCDGSILKDLLKDYSPEQVKLMVDEFFRGATDADTWWSDKVSIPIFRKVLPQVIGRLRRNAE